MSNSIAPGSSADVNVKVTALTTNPNVPVTYKTIILKKNLVNGVNTLTQEMMSTTNTKYVIKYDYALGEDIIVPEECILEFDGGSLDNGILTLNNSFIIGKVSLRNTKCKGTIKGELASYQSWFSDIDTYIYFINNVDGQISYNLSSGTYYPTRNIYKRTDYNVEINGNGCELVFDKDKYEYDGGTVHVDILAKTNIEFTQNLLNNETAPVGGLQVEDVSKFKVGDLCAVVDETVASYNPTRQYQQGEFFIVSGFNGNKLIPETYLVGNYVHADEESGRKCKVSKVNTIYVSIRNLTIKRTDDYILQSGEWNFGLRLRYARVTLENVSVLNHVYGIMHYYCYNCNIHNCIANAQNAVYAGQDSYGLGIASCQMVNVTGGFYKAGNHGITIGSAYGGLTAVVSRYVTVYGVKAASNKFDSGIDMHGGVEYITIDSCFSKGISLRGNKIKAINNQLLDGVISINELCGFDFTVSGNSKVSYIGFSTSVGNDYNPDELYNWTQPTGEEICEISNNSIGYISFVIDLPDGYYKNIDNVTLIIKNNEISSGTTNNRIYLYPKRVNDDVLYGIIRNNKTKLLFCNNTIDGGSFEIIANSINIHDNNFCNTRIGRMEAEFVNIERNTITFNLNDDKWNPFLYRDPSCPYIVENLNINNNIFNNNSSNPYKDMLMIYAYTKSFIEDIVNLEQHINIINNIFIGKEENQNYFFYIVTKSSREGVDENIKIFTCNNIIKNKKQFYIESYKDFTSTENITIIHHLQTIPAAYFSYNKENYPIVRSNNKAYDNANSVNSIIDKKEILTSKIAPQSSTTTPYIKVSLNNANDIENDNIIIMFNIIYSSNSAGDVRKFEVYIYVEKSTSTIVCTIIDRGIINNVDNAVIRYNSETQNLELYIHSMKMAAYTDGIISNFYQNADKYMYSVNSVAEIPEATENDVIGKIKIVNRFGDKNLRNWYSSYGAGIQYFDTDINKPLFINKNGTYVTADGVQADINTSGTFEQKPTVNDLIPVGFRYFCTDRQTQEGATNGIEIIHKGNNVWVDALGRIVS